MPRKRPPQWQKLYKLLGAQHVYSQLPSAGLDQLGPKTSAVDRSLAIGSSIYGYKAERKTRLRKLEKWRSEEGLQRISAFREKHGLDPLPKTAAEAYLKNRLYKAKESKAPVTLPKLKFLED